MAGYSLVLEIVYLVFGLIEVFGVLERQYQGMYFGIPGMETDEGLDMVTGNW